MQHVGVGDRVSLQASTTVCDFITLRYCYCLCDIDIDIALLLFITCIDYVRVDLCAVSRQGMAGPARHWFSLTVYQWFPGAKIYKTCEPKLAPDRAKIGVIGA